MIELSISDIEDIEVCPKCGVLFIKDIGKLQGKEYDRYFVCPACKARKTYYGDES